MHVCMCVYVHEHMTKGGAQVKGRRSHLKAMKDLIAGKDRNDNVCEGTLQQTRSPPIISGIKLSVLFTLHLRYMLSNQ